jgi:hypothetical protein
MKTLLSICLSTLAIACSAQPRLTERPLADIARIGVPANLSNEDKLTVLVAPSPGSAREQSPYRTDLMERLTFGFSSTYLWASMGSITAYRQQLIVSVMAPDATDEEYASPPGRMAIRYEQRRRLPVRTLGTGTLTTFEGIYARGSVTEPAYQFVYADRARRLQLVWHAVRKEVDLDSGVAQIERIAASFRLVRDPLDWFAAMRAAPRQEAEMRAGRLASVKAMLKREGYGVLEPGKPVLRNGVYLEWMSDPEPRYQLLVPLGRVRAAANGSVVDRPRPLPQPAGAPAAGKSSRPLAGTIGWREVADGDWVFSNRDNAYLPFKGIGAMLAARQQDRGFVFFFYSATVRVEEASDERLLNSLSWFLDGVPDVQARWREGALVGPGKPEQD